MSCTPIPEGLKIVGHLITCSSDFRVWEAPKTKKPYKGKLEYIEATGEVRAGKETCERVWPAEGP